MKSQGTAATQKDVARLAGVSQAVVSVVLGKNIGNIGASPEVSNRVREAAQRLNYRPNLSARSMRHGRFFNIGYFAATKNFNEFDFAPVRAGIYDAASEQGYHVMMIRLPSHLSKDPNAIPKTFKEAHLDALIVTPVSMPISAIQEVMAPANNLPIVYLNTKETYGSVYVDDLLGGRLATEHLYNQGFRRIAFLSADMEQMSDHYSMRDRIESYTSVMAEHGLVAQMKRWDVNVYEEEFKPDTTMVIDSKGRERLVDWMTGPNRPEAIVCYSDPMAMVLIQTLSKLGIKVPEDIAITGYNNDPAGYLSACPLTTIHMPHYEMAVAAVNMAIGMINNTTEVRPPPSIRFSPTLIVRESSRNVGASITTSS